MFRHCPRCGTKFQLVNLSREGYCYECARWVPMDSSREVREQTFPYIHDDEDTIRRLSLFGLIVFYFTMISNLAGLAYAIYLVPRFLVNENTLTLFFLTPAPPFLVSIGSDVGGTGLVFYFLFLVASIMVSIEMMLIRDGRSFSELGKRILTDNQLTADERVEFDSNGFVLLGELFMAVLFFNAFYIITLLLFGIETESPNFDELETWELMFTLARASVWEEVVSRILYIGLPLFFLHLITGKDLTNDDMAGNGVELDGAWYRHLLGGNLSVTPLTAFLVLFSSLLFGLAHISSWDAFKIAPTVVGGIALGYLFLKKGVHVSIMLHFAIDYLSILPGSLEGRPAEGLELAIGMAIIIMLSMGAYMFYKYARQTLVFIDREMMGSSWFGPDEEDKWEQGEERYQEDTTDPEGRMGSVERMGSEERYHKKGNEEESMGSRWETSVDTEEMVKDEWGTPPGGGEMGNDGWGKSEEVEAIMETGWGSPGNGTEPPVDEWQDQNDEGWAKPQENMGNGMERDQWDRPAENAMSQPEDSDVGEPVESDWVKEAKATVDVIPLQRSYEHIETKKTIKGSSR
jgi:hypothetical protein